MTLLVGLRGVNGMVVAADSRGTFGDPRGVTAQNDAQQKLYKASKYAAILTAGSGELGAKLIDEILKTIPENDDAVQVMDKTRNTLRTRFAEWFPGFAMQQMPQNTVPTRPDVSFMVAGYERNSNGNAAEQRIFQLLSQLDFAPMLHNYGFGLVGISQYALYLLNRFYQADSNVDHLKALAAYVITETASQDGKVGGKVRIATITPADGCRELSEDDVAAIIKNNESRNKSLKDSFFEAAATVEV